MPTLEVRADTVTRLWRATGASRGHTAYGRCCGGYRSVGVRVDAQGGGTALVQGLPARARVVVTGTAALKSLATGS